MFLRIMKSSGVIASALLFLFSVQVISGSRFKSLTFDEVSHIPAGYSYLVTGDYRMNFLHPPLTKYLAGLPLLFLNLPDPTTFVPWDSTDDFAFGKAFISALGPRRDLVTALSRAAMIVLALMLGLGVFQWATELWGPHQGLFALLLYALEPAIIAHTQLVTPDLGVTLFIFLSVYCLWRFSNLPSTKNLLLTGVALGCALLSKLNALLLIGLVPALLYFFSDRTRISLVARRVSMIFLVAFLTVWAGYGFETGTVLHKKDIHATARAASEGLPQPAYRALCSMAEEIAVPIPSYWRGLGQLLYYARKEKRESFWFGRHFRGGSLWGSMAAFCIKTPIPILVFFVFALLFRRKRLLSKDQLFLLLPITAFFAMAPFHISLSLKFLLPVYPFVIVFASQLCDTRSLTGPRKAILGALSLWLAIGTLAVYPNYLAYFNETIGGPKNGYMYLVDSNLDWGQDLPLLKDFLTGHGIKKIKLAYFGSADPVSYGIPYETLQPSSPTTGWIAVSATYLEGVHVAPNAYFWLKSFEPIEKIGYSIFVYNIKDIS